MTRTLALAAVLALAWRSSAGAQSAIRAPVPVYPLECRARGITGSGVVLATVDKKTGAVIGARMLKSTGNKLLDGSALEALSRWRFKPGTVSQVQIPINFTMASTRTTI
jgi:periplasmic protein TonB